MNVVCFTREYKFTMHNQQKSKMATKNDNIAEKINDGGRRNVYIDISFLIVSPASCFFMTEYGSWDEGSH